MFIESIPRGSFDPERGDLFSATDGTKLVWVANGSLNNGDTYSIEFESQEGSEGDVDTVVFVSPSQADLSPVGVLRPATLEEMTALVVRAETDLPNHPLCTQLRELITDRVLEAAGVLGMAVVGRTVGAQSIAGQ